MKLPPHARRLTAIGLFGLPFLSSCANDIVFATHTSTGLDVSGDIAKIPDHVSLGFRRREIAYVGKNVPKTASVLGRLDSQTNWNGGLAIRETFATGPAADAIASEKPLPQGTGDPSSTSLPDHPLVFASRTRAGFGFSLGGSDDDAIPSLHFGYTRRIATRMQIDPKATAEDIPSIIADTSVHGSGAQDAANAPITPGLDPDARISPGKNSANDQGGIRIRQLFAVGKGATSLVKTPEEAKKIKDAITQEPQGNTTPQ